MGSPLWNRTPEPGANGHNYPEGVRDWDPVNMAGMAEAYGRIGGVAWAVFERGAGHILSIEAMSGNRSVITIDTPGERRGLRELWVAINRITGDAALPGLFFGDTAAPVAKAEIHCYPAKEKP